MVVQLLFTFGMGYLVWHLLADPDTAGHTLPGKDENGGPEVFCRYGLTKGEAEEVLDWIEANGCRYRELAHDGEVGFTVLWQPGPGTPLPDRNRMLPTC
jgi:hypothetical protein